jgi:glycosyltransferase involved in cell wall biosynthesis
MKILVISSKYQPEYSGSGLRAHNTYKRLEKDYNLDFDILSNSISNQGNKKYNYDGVDVIRISPPFKIVKKKSIWRKILILLSIFWEVFYSWKYIRKKINDYSLLHTFGNTWTIGFLTWYFAKKNKPVIRELCNDMSNPLYPIQIQNYMKFIFKRNNTLVVAISKRLEILAKSFDVKNIWCRPNPVNEKKFFVDYKKKYFLRNKLTKFNQNDIVMCLVANFIDRKNQLFALEVLSLLPKNFKLILSGPLKKENEEYFNLLVEKINKLELHDRVDLQKGFIENFDEYIKCSDVFLFPSKAEGLGTPLLESQVCGVPVISNFIRNITDPIIEKNKGGYFLELNAEMWAKKIQKVIKIPKEELIENAKLINNICSSKLIDNEYYKKINKLIFSEN